MKLRGEAGVGDDACAGMNEMGDLEPSLRFASAVVLSKSEAFEVCSSLWDAERALMGGGRPAEAAKMASWFQVIESRLASG